jgi:hypothetical protein
VYEWGGVNETTDQKAPYTVRGKYVGNGNVVVVVVVVGRRTEMILAARIRLALVVALDSASAAISKAITVADRVPPMAFTA